MDGKIPDRAEPAPQSSRRTYLRGAIELRRHGCALNCHGCDAARLNTSAKPLITTSKSLWEIARLMSDPEKNKSWTLPCWSATLDTTTRTTRTASTCCCTGRLGSRWMPRNSTMGVLCHLDAWTTFSSQGFAQHKFLSRSLLVKARAWLSPQAGCAIISVRNCSRDLGRVRSAHFKGDASAARGSGALRGAGRIRDIET